MVSETAGAGPVGCSALDTSHGHPGGTGGSLSQEVSEQGVNLVSTWDFQAGRTCQPRCGLRPPPVPREYSPCDSTTSSTNSTVASTSMPGSSPSASSTSKAPSFVRPPC